MEFKKLVLPIDLAVRLWLQIPIPVVHNLEKAMMIKRIFWNLNVDGTEGCYLEFGVAHGHSMRAADVATRRTSSRSLNVAKTPRNLYGFDTFQGFISANAQDRHATWNGDKFTLPLVQIQKRFKKSKNIKFVKVDVSTLATNKNQFTSAENIGIKEKASLILFDMDLFEPTLAGLRWSKQLIKTGTYLMFDELYAFEGNPDRGESKALKMFLDENSDISLIHFMSYGAGGQVFIVVKKDNDK